MIRTEISLERERCFLVAALVRGRYAEYEDPLAELAALVDTAGGQVVGRITQNIDRPHPRTFLGKGKFEDMVEEVQAAHADTVVVDDDLTPSQLSTIEDACRRKVIDRSEVILDIFAARARTHQAKLQVELAQSQYELPRLVRKWTHLERLGGGIGTRGPGESQIETDRRILRRKITLLRKQLDKIERRKTREVQARSSAFTACLVGYTNAGKSTLLNRITGAEAPAEDKLFATVDTLTRHLELDDGPEVLISDTVGFIRRLPHHLVASFHATLEEAAQADLLLHVVDAADPLARLQMQAVDTTLESLGMRENDRVYVFNKCDAVTDHAALEGLRNLVQPVLTLSAISGTGLDELLRLLKQKAEAGQRQYSLRFPAADGRRFSMVNDLGQVMDVRYEGADVILTVRMDAVSLARIRALPGSMAEIQGACEPGSPQQT